MPDFNFDIDQIANNAITKNDKTTEIISHEASDVSKPISFLEKLSSCWYPMG